MRIREGIQDDVAVLKVAGHLMSRPQVVEFHGHVKRLVDDQVVHLVADFSEVIWFGSAMLGVLAASLVTVRKVGGDLRLTGLNPTTDHALAVTHLNTVFRVFEQVDEAVASYQSAQFKSL
ncbi:MAG: STAS domain-containing protein [Candidatus Latescibacteria bacterium]|jgi:anti-anti-sigma factor|nr:STAS domain-containing protein [Candidatus Latescibacterota bacterium]